MDYNALAHQFRKSQMDGAPSTSNGGIRLPPPPAYTPSATIQPPPRRPHPSIDDDEDEGGDDDEDDDEDDLDARASATTTVNVTAPVRLMGHGNILNMASVTSMVGSSVATAVRQHQEQQQSQRQSLVASSALESDGDSKMRRRERRLARPIFRPLILNVNCGVTIVGSRNIVGEPLVKAAALMRLSSTSPSGTGDTTAPSSSTTHVDVGHQITGSTKRAAEEVRPSFIVEMTRPLDPRLTDRV